MSDHESMTDVGCTDPELSQELRDALTILRDHSDNDDFRTLADDVLAGGAAWSRRPARRRSATWSSRVSRRSSLIWAPTRNRVSPREPSRQGRPPARAAARAPAAPGCVQLLAATQASKGRVRRCTCSTAHRRGTVGPPTVDPVVQLHRRQRLRLLRVLTAMDVD